MVLGPGPGGHLIQIVCYQTWWQGDHLNQVCWSRDILKQDGYTTSPTLKLTILDTKGKTWSHHTSCRGRNHIVSKSELGDQLELVACRDWLQTSVNSLPVTITFRLIVQYIYKTARWRSLFLQTLLLNEDWRCIQWGSAEFVYSNACSQFWFTLDLVVKVNW